MASVSVLYNACSKLREKCSEVEVEGHVYVILRYFLCPEIPNPEVLLRKEIRHGVKLNMPFLSGNEMNPSSMGCINPIFKTFVIFPKYLGHTRE